MLRKLFLSLLYERLEPLETSFIDQNTSAALPVLEPPMLRFGLTARYLLFYLSIDTHHALKDYCLLDQVLRAGFRSSIRSGSEQWRTNPCPVVNPGW